MPTSITQRLVRAADDSRRPALVPPPPLAPYSFAGLVATVQRAAAGLAWRGLRPSDVIGVYVPDAAWYVLACHAVRAAGGVPSPVNLDLSVPEVAGQLADCGARMLLTAPPLAAAAVAAADRSWVRQVISFGEAPATTAFGSLLGAGSMPPPNARPRDLAMLPYVRRADGSLQAAGQTHLDLAAELSAVAATTGITAMDTVLALPPSGDGRAYTALVDHALLQGATVVAAQPGELETLAARYHATAVIGPPGSATACAPPLRVWAVAPGQS